MRFLSSGSMSSIQDCLDWANKLADVKVNVKQFQIVQNQGVYTMIVMIEMAESRQHKAISKNAALYTITPSMPMQN